MRNTIKIFTTGGSIDKIYSTQSSQFVVGAPQAGAILVDANVTCAYEIEALLEKYSLEINDEDRVGIVAWLRGEPSTRILITHGTDTMVNTALALTEIPAR